MLLLYGVNVNESVTVYIWLVPKMFSLCYAFLTFIPNVFQECYIPSNIQNVVYNNKAAS